MNLSGSKTNNYILVFILGLPNLKEAEIQKPNFHDQTPTPTHGTHTNRATRSRLPPLARPPELLLPNLPLKPPSFHCPTRLGSSLRLPCLGMAPRPYTDQSGRATMDQTTFVIIFITFGFPCTDVEDYE
jgi:hypothetical protein